MLLEHKRKDFVEMQARARAPTVALVGVADEAEARFSLRCTTR